MNRLKNLVWILAGTLFVGCGTSDLPGTALFDSGAADTSFFFNDATSRDAGVVADGSPADGSPKDGAVVDQQIAVDLGPVPDGFACSPGAFMGCNGSNKVVCAADGKSQTQIACPSGCNLSAKRCNSCVPNTVLGCNTNSLQKCSASGVPISQHCQYGCYSGTTKTPVTPKGAAGGSGKGDSVTPAGSTARCNECQPNTATCSGNNSIKCSATGLKQSPVACAYGCDQTTGQCLNCQKKTWYRDADGDGYGQDSVMAESCLQPSGYVDKKGDCDDTDTNVKPGQTAWFTQKSKGGIWDYNCDGIDNKRWVQKDACTHTQSACGPSNEGWEAVVPSCGQTGDWSDCAWNSAVNPPECEIQASPKVQSCH